MENYLVRVKEGNFINRLGIIVRNMNYNYDITFNFKTTEWIDKNKVEILSEEPQFNQFGRLNCYWCNEKLKFIFIKNKKINYCPVCLR